MRTCLAAALDATTTNARACAPPRALRRLSYAAKLRDATRCRGGSSAKCDAPRDTHDHELPSRRHSSCPSARRRGISVGGHAGRGPEPANWATANTPVLSFMRLHMVSVGVDVSTLTSTTKLIVRFCDGGISSDRKLAPFEIMRMPQHVRRRRVWVWLYPNSVLIVCLCLRRRR